jgi:hypothetical protein
MGFSSGGFSKCAVMVAGPHSPFVMSVIQVRGNFFAVTLTGFEPATFLTRDRHLLLDYFAYLQMVACGSLLIGSFTVPAITPTNSFNEWRNVFSLYAVILVSAGGR